MGYIFYTNDSLYCSCRKDKPGGASKVDGLLDEVFKRHRVVGLVCPDCKSEWTIIKKE